jgi:hypothetical protein
MIDATILRIRGQHEHAPTRDRTGPGELSAPATRHVDALDSRVTAPSARAARGVRCDVIFPVKPDPAEGVQPQRVQSNRKLTQDAFTARHQSAKANLTVRSCRFETDSRQA